jgi:hypothetical protein
VGRRHYWKDFGDSDNDWVPWDQKVRIQNNASALPTWVPDWRCEEMLFPFGGFGDFHAATNV